MRNIFGSVTAWPGKAVLGTCHQEDQPNRPFRDKGEIPLLSYLILSYQIRDLGAICTIALFAASQLRITGWVFLSLHIWDPDLTQTSQELFQLSKLSKIIIVEISKLSKTLSTLLKKCQKLWNFSKHFEIVKYCKKNHFFFFFKNGPNLSKIVKNCQHCHFHCKVMSPYLSDQTFQRLQVSRVALCMSKVKVPLVS